MGNPKQGDYSGSSISNGREPRSSLCWVFNSKTANFASWQIKCVAYTKPLLELKTRPWLCTVNFHYYLMQLGLCIAMGNPKQGDYSWSSISNGREPRSILCWVFNSKTANFASWQIKCVAYTKPLLELKTRPWLRTVNLHYYLMQLGL